MTCWLGPHANEPRALQNPPCNLCDPRHNYKSPLAGSAISGAGTAEEGWGARNAPQRRPAGELMELAHKEGRQLDDHISTRHWLLLERQKSCLPFIPNQAAAQTRAAGTAQRAATSAASAPKMVETGCTASRSGGGGCAAADTPPPPPHAASLASVVEAAAGLSLSDASSTASGCVDNVLGEDDIGLAGGPVLLGGWRPSTEQVAASPAAPLLVAAPPDLACQRVLSAHDPCCLPVNDGR